MIKYVFDQQINGELISISCILFIFLFDFMVIFECESSWFDIIYIQMLELWFYYVNIFYKDQSKILVFDFGFFDFNFVQIFFENCYSGFDWINDVNQLMVVLIICLFDVNIGVE